VNPYWKSACGRFTLYHGDCVEVLPTLDGVDAVVSDPPFGIAYVHSGGGRSPPNGDGVRAATGRRNSGIKIAGDSQPFDPSHLCLRWPCLLWGANHYAARIPSGGTWIAWDKAVGLGPDDTFADCEFAWCSLAGVKRNIVRFLWKGIACVKVGEDGGERVHPMQKPVGLMRASIGLLGLGADATVCDPYAGSGSTGMACVRDGYRFVGIEIDERYCEVASRRIEAEAHHLFAGTM
jgi:site-specific DNA-methyltransferase (adenine-specific)/modification methylase